MFEWANKDPCQPQPQQLQLGLHSGWCQTHTRHCICAGVQPSLLYLYRCSTYASLSVLVFKHHFSICTGVQPTLLYLYWCSTYTVLSAQVFNLHCSICTGVQPTLLSTAVSTSFTPKWEKPKELGNLEQLILSFLGDQGIDFAVMLNLVGLTSCIWTV